MNRLQPTLLAVALLLAGCSGPKTEPVVPGPPPTLPASSTPAPSTVAPSPSAPAHAAPRPAAKQPANAAPRPVRTGDAEKFVSAVHASLPQVTLDRRDDELTDLGLELCAALAAGRGAPAAAAGLADYGVEAADARRLAGLARTELCPT